MENIYKPTISYWISGIIVSGLFFFFALFGIIGNFYNGDFDISVILLFLLLGLVFLLQVIGHKLIVTDQYIELVGPIIGLKTGWSNINQIERREHGLVLLLEDPIQVKLRGSFGHIGFLNRTTKFVTLFRYLEKTKTINDIHRSELGRELSIRLGHLF